VLTILGWLFIGFFFGSLVQVFRNEPETTGRTVLIGVCGAFGDFGGSPFRPGQGNTGFLISLALGLVSSLAALFIYHHALSLNVAGVLRVWVSLIRDRAPLLARNYEVIMIQQWFQTWETAAATLISMKERRTPRPDLLSPYI
jgi:uncharacterized membrane protein YeaQ/YmgE (transglycosylase-associated protein family)